MSDTIETADGKVIPRDRAAFHLRDVTHEGNDYKVGQDGAVYMHGSNGGLRRLNKPDSKKKRRKLEQAARRNS